MKRNLEDKVIVITGASSGIGAATAIACAKAGMHVALAARREDRLREMAARIEQIGRRALVIPCDVRRDGDVDQIFAQTINEFGQLDVVFANAGYGICAPVLDSPIDQVRDMFETNYYGTVRCVAAAANYMQRNGSGHILICSSAASELGIPLYGHYAATKAAQDAIACALRAELHDKNVYVTSVHPIGTNTEFFEAASELSLGGDHPAPTLNMPKSMMHSSEKVAKAIVRCLHRPQPEVWPSVGTRFGLAMLTAFPRLSALVMRKMIKRRGQKQ